MCAIRERELLYKGKGKGNRRTVPFLVPVPVPNPFPLMRFPPVDKTITVNRNYRNLVATRAFKSLDISRRCSIGTFSNIGENITSCGKFFIIPSNCPIRWASEIILLLYSSSPSIPLYPEGFKGGFGYRPHHIDGSRASTNAALSISHTT